MPTRYFTPKINKLIIVTTFIIVFFSTLVINIPTWILGNQIKKHSSERLRLYNQAGTFWNGSGLLVATDEKSQHGTPIIFINWKLSLGFTKFIDVQFFAGNSKFANAYLNKNGLNLDNLDLNLSIIQISQLVDLIKDFNISGNLNIASKHILIGKQSLGQINIAIKNVSTSLSPVNPLGNYNMLFDVSTGNITIDSLPGSILTLNGNGNTNNLILNARVDPQRASEMKQFISIMGIPKSDGSFELKLF